MKDMYILKKISYYKIKSEYYSLLSKREIEFDCFSQNFDYSNSLSKSNCKEKDEINKCKIQYLQYCLKNIKEYKRLDEEIKDTKTKLLKAKNKLYKRD